MWGNIFVCCRDQNSALNPHGRPDLETLYNSVLVASWNWHTNRWRIVYSGLVFGKPGSKPQTFVHSLTLSPGPSSVLKKNCRKFSVTEGLPHSWFLLLILILGGFFLIWKKKRKESPSSWNLENFSVPFLSTSSPENYREKPRNMTPKLFFT